MPDASSLTWRERLALCDLFEELGPEAPTLCEGWTTADLAAHLVIRENDPLAAPGIVLGGPARTLNQRAMERNKRRGFHWMVDRLRRGPPWGPMRLGAVDRSQLMEWFIHHEDARRANGRQPRQGIDELDERLWAVLRTGGRFMTRRIQGVGLELRTTAALGDGESESESVTIRPGEPLVRMTGRPSEMALFLSGRASHADVELDGDPDAVTALRTASLGI